MVSIERLLEKRSFSTASKHRFRGAFRISLEELILNAECKDDEHDNRQDIAYIEADIILDLESAAFVGLLLEVLPAPAAAGGAEQQVNQRTERQPDVGHEEVLEVEHVRACAERLEAGPDIEAEHARQF